MTVPCPEPQPSVARRARIVVTIGPASREDAVLQALLSAGADVCRVNCSHLGPGQIGEEIERIHRVGARLGRNVTVLADLQGPKIRTGPAESPVHLARGDRLVIVMDAQMPADPGSRRVGCTFPALARDLAEATTDGTPQRVLFADGEISGDVTALRLDLDPAEVEVRIVDGGDLGAHKGINVPGAALSAPSLTAKDLRDLEEAVSAGVDWVALSFVRRASDLDDLHEHLRLLGVPDLPVCAKIEKPQALDDLAAILHRVSAVMVARGDLGVEMPLCGLGLVQKHLIRAANRAGVLAITATQMLESMQHSPRPTRAEVTDVGNAILDGTDAVMLSAETAVGDYPVQAVQIMDAIVRQTEQSDLFQLPDLGELPLAEGLEATIARAACFAARSLKRPIVVFSWSGASAVMVSKSRPPAAIFALTPNETTADFLGLAWGVVPVKIPLVTDLETLLEVGETELLDRGLVRPGDEVIVMAGNAPARGSSNLLKVERIRKTPVPG
jgi:pyruvate kinase